MKKLLTAMAVAGSLTLGACANMQSNDLSTYNGVMAEAAAQHAVAKEHKNVWKQKKMKKPYVEHYMAKAEAAKKKGNDAAAMEWAQKALKSARAEVRQSQQHASTDPAWLK